MTYNAVIFDLDGTLLDTLGDIANSMNRVLLDNRLPAHPVERYRYFVGEGVRRLAQQALPENSADDDLLNRCVKSFHEIYSQNWHATTQPYPGIPELLASLSGRPLKLAVLSNKPHDFTRLCVKRFFPDIRFHAITGNRQGVPPKPDPESAIQISESLNTPPERFIFTGDTAIDMKTAIGAGMFPVGVLWGFRSKEELVQNGAKALIGHPGELLSIIDGTMTASDQENRP